MSTARKLPPAPKPARKKVRKHPRLTAAGEPWPKPLTKKEDAERLRWLDQDPPFKPQGPAIVGEELEEAIRTGGMS